MTAFEYILQCIYREIEKSPKPVFTSDQVLEFLDRLRAAREIDRREISKGKDSTQPERQQTPPPQIGGKMIMIDDPEEYG